MRKLEREIGESVTVQLSENFSEHFGDQVDDRIETALPSEIDTRPRPWLPRRRSKPGSVR
ncbi:MAG: hypothetical protein ACLGHS_08625 [Actinomycetes bacterium]